MILSHKEPWAEQPPQFDAVLDPDHPLVNGLVFDLAPPSSLNFFNTVDGRKANSGPGASLSPQKYGTGHAIAQSADNGILFNGYVIVNAFPFSLLVAADTVAEANRKWFLSLRPYDAGTSAPAFHLGVNAVASGGSSADSSGSLYLFTLDGSNQSSPTTGAAGAVTAGVHFYGVTCDGTTTTYYVDGKLHTSIGQVNANAVFNASQSVRVGGFCTNNNTRQFDRSQIITRIWNNRLLSEADFKAQLDYPFGIYLPKTKLFWMGAGAGGAAALAGNAAAQETISGSLSTQIPIAGAQVSSDAATGALTTLISPAGAAVSIDIANGVLTAQIRFSGDALSQMLMTGTFGGSAAALAGAAASSGTDTGVLTTQIQLSGAEISQALLAAGLTTVPAGFSGAAVSSAAVAAQLSTGIPLAGTASSIAVSAAGLTTGIPLAGVEVSACNVTGNLLVNAGFSAAALSRASETGVLSTQIKLNAAAVAQALASASLSDAAAAARFVDPRYTLRLPRRDTAIRLPRRDYALRCAA